MGAESMSGSTEPAAMTPEEAKAYIDGRIGGLIEREWQTRDELFAAQDKFERAIRAVVAVRNMDMLVEVGLLTQPERDTARINYLAKKADQYAEKEDNFRTFVDDFRAIEVATQGKDSQTALRDIREWENRLASGSAKTQQGIIDKGKR
jgi:hypothetical protein